MADKEATVFVVDVCRSMGQNHQDREVSDLEYTLQYVWDKISGIVQTGRKTLQCGVVALGSNSSKNDMQHEEGYEHIEVVRPIGQLLLADLQRLPEQLKVSSTSEKQRDTLSGIIIGVDMIMKHCKQLKFKKKLVVCTNGLGLLDPDQLQDVAAQIKDNDIKLIVLGVDFDDPEYGFKEEDKPSGKKENEEALRRLAEDSGGMYGTMQEAVEGLARPEVKVTRPVPTYRGSLRLGDPENYDTALTIDVERYFKVSVRRAPTATSFAVKQDTDESGLANVSQSFAYYVKDESKPNNQVPVDRDDLAKGYQYGRTAVHISQADENITKLETFSSYDILGFIPAENVERYAIIDNSNMLVSQKGNDKAALALSSLIHALFELGSVAVARFVKKDMAEPMITLLSPSVEPDFECLIENVLPFAEDVRTYRFPPLDKVLTVSGRALTEHRNLPSDDLLQSMSDFVDSMSLIENDEELLPMDDTFSPVLHTIEGAVKHRAVHPDKPLPAKPELFATYARQPEHLQEASRPALERLIQAAEVKKIPPRAKGRRRYRDAEKPLSNLDVGALLKKQDRHQTISPDNAIPEFRQWLDQTDDFPQVKEAVKQMGAIVQKLVADSYGDQNYARAIEALGVVREEIVKLEMADIWNDLLREVKEKLKKGELGGERREWWYQLRGKRLGLIDNTENQYGGVKPEETKEFWSLRT
jgi:ATP-dependent DNA helicase 2 subunit 2